MSDEIRIQIGGKRDYIIQTVSLYAVVCYS